jgi:CheY-like chemotaxis protein
MLRNCRALFALMEDVTRPRAVLLIDDNPNDAFLLRRALDSCPSVDIVQSVEGVEEAQCYLQGVGEYADRNKYPMPGMIFLDLFLGRRNWTEFLIWAKEHACFKVIPIVALTGSIPEDRATEVLSYGANAVMSKGVDCEALKQGLLRATDLWLRHCIGSQLPAEAG